MESVLAALASPPQFRLPPATLGHSRHYMRWFKKGPLDQTLVFDAFVHVGRERETIAIWPDASLDGDQAALLSHLLGHLTYLGRAESWCEARLIEGVSAKDLRPNSRPLGPDERSQPGEELVRVLCADPDTAFSGEHVRAKKGRPVYDPAWNLAVETAQLHKEKWSDPPGAKWVAYVRPEDCFHPKPARVHRQRVRPTMQVARYALDATVLPLTGQTLPVAERVRGALMARMPKEGERRRPSRIFSGKAPDGTPLEGHRHAYFLPTDEDGDGRLDHVTVVAEDGFDDDEVRALDRLRVLYPRQGREEPEIRLLLLGLARSGQLAARPLGPSRVWTSATPFVATRHPKKNGRRRDPPELLADPVKFLAVNLREELDRFAARKGGAVRSVEPITDEHGAFRSPPALGPVRRPLEFKRFRSKRTDDGGRRRSGFFRVEFEEPVRGPVALGHSAHFGMGLFLAADD